MRTDGGLIIAIAGSKNVRTQNYKKMLAKLPESTQKLAEMAFQAFLQDPATPVLRNHQLGNTDKGRHRQGSRSVSITQRYRAIYVIDDDTNVWYWVGSHQNYNTYLGSK